MRVPLAYPVAHNRMCSGKDGAGRTADLLRQGEFLVYYRHVVQDFDCGRFFPRSFKDEDASVTLPFGAVQISAVGRRHLAAGSEDQSGVVAWWYSRSRDSPTLSSFLRYRVLPSTVAVATCCGRPTLRATPPAGPCARFLELVPVPADPGQPTNVVKHCHSPMYVWVLVLWEGLTSCLLCVYP